MNQLGVIGLGTMGANLARNAARNGATVLLFNRTAEKTDTFMKNFGSEGKFIATKSLKEFVDTFAGTRVILLMVKAGEAVDAMIAELLPLLQKGDILIDAGNSHYRDTERRMKELAVKNIHLIGMGVSGGEEGALHGPSMMPWGDTVAVAFIEPLLAKMAADDGSTELATGGKGGKCITYLGPGGSGHFVKTVHNGIEYGIMQLLAEAYHLLHTTGDLSTELIADEFEEWNKSEWLQSFLLDISIKVLRTKDPETGNLLIDVIKDSAAQKGTGKWTTDAAMSYGIAIPTITAAVDARIISSAKNFRMEESKKGLEIVDQELPVDFAEQVRSALELSIINTYAQGFQLLQAASDAEGWKLPIPEIARIWSGGCIIRSSLLPYWEKMFSGDKKAAQAVRDRFSGVVQKQWRTVVAHAALRGIPVPALSASLSYFDAYRTERLPQNLIQGQRDFFGAHTFERLDKPGSFHFSW